MVGNLDVDYATGPFCSSCAIPPRKAGGGLWCFKRGSGERGGLSLGCGGVGYDVCCYDCDTVGVIERWGVRVFVLSVELVFSF